MQQGYTITIIIATADAQAGNGSFWVAGTKSLESFETFKK